MAIEQILEKSIDTIRPDHVGRYRFACDWIKTGWSVLDIACGCGYGSYLLGERAAQVIAVDRNPQAISWAKKYYSRENVHYFCREWQSFEAENVYDVVVSFETIEHLYDDASFLVRVSEWLKPGGLFILSTPNEQYMPFHRVSSTFHLRHYYPFEIERLLSEAGFECRKILFQKGEESSEPGPDPGRFALVVAGKQRPPALLIKEYRRSALFVADGLAIADWQGRVGEVFHENGITPYSLADVPVFHQRIERYLGNHAVEIDMNGRSTEGRIDPSPYLFQLGTLPPEGARERAAYTAGQIRRWIDHIHPTFIVMWNGNGTLLRDLTRDIAQEKNIPIVFLELGYFRDSPNSLIVDRTGVNYYSRKLKDYSFTHRLHNADTADRLQQWKSTGLSKPYSLAQLPPQYVFFPLQVHDDTQIYFHSPWFSSVEEALQATVRAMPDDLPLVVKPHPVDKTRYGTEIYRRHLRNIDLLVSTSENTHRLIEGSLGVITINSTAGLEGIFFHKPVLVLGNAFYSKEGLAIPYQGGELSVYVNRLLSFSPDPERVLGMADYLLSDYLFLYEGNIMEQRMSDREIRALARRIALEVGILISSERKSTPLQLLAPWIEHLDRAVRSFVEREDLTTIRILGVGSTAMLISPALSKYVKISGVFDSSPQQQKTRFLGKKVSPTGKLHSSTDCPLVFLSSLSATRQSSVVESLAREYGLTKVFTIYDILKGYPLDQEGILLQALSRHWTDCFDREKANTRFCDDYGMYHSIDFSNPYLKQGQIETIVAAVRAFTPGSIIEFGCGDGRILEAIARSMENVSLTGSDISSVQLKAADYRLSGKKVRLIRQRIEEYDGSSSYDVGVACELLHHLFEEDIPEFIHRLCKSIRKYMFHWERLVPGKELWNSQYFSTPDGNCFSMSAACDTYQEELREVEGIPLPISWLSEKACFLKVSMKKSVFPALVYTTVDRSCSKPGTVLAPLYGEDFEDQINAMFRQGYRTISLSSLIGWMEERIAFDDKPVLITFDGGYASLMEAKAIMDKYGFRGNLFISRDTLEGAKGNPRKKGNSPTHPSLLTSLQIRELLKSGWEIGIIPCEETIAPGYLPEENLERLKEEVAILRQQFHVAVEISAFPYEGICASEILKVKSCLPYAMTSEAGFIRRDHIPWLLPRIPVSREDSLDAFFQKIRQAYRRTGGCAEPRTVPWDRYRLASALQEEGDYILAESLFKELLRGYYEPPNRAELYWRIFFHLGELSKYKGEMDKAILYFQQCLQILPSHKKAKRHMQNCKKYKTDPGV